MRISLDLLLTVTLLLTGCQTAIHEAHASATKWERDVAITWGGTTHTTGADGWANSTDHNASFQVAVQAGGTAYAAGKAAATQASNNALSATKDTNAAGITKNAADNVTKQNLDKLNAASTDLKTTTQGGNAVQLSTILKKGPPKVK